MVLTCLWHGFVLERSTEIELTFLNPDTPTFPEFPELAIVTTAFRLDDDVLQEVKKVIIETHRLQLKQRIGKGSYITLERQINNRNSPGQPVYVPISRELWQRVQGSFEPKNICCCQSDSR